MLVVSFLTILAVVSAGTLRGLDFNASVSYSLVWSNSDSISSNWVTATCNTDSGKNLIASNSNFNTYVSKDFGVSFTMTGAPSNLGFYALTSDSTGQYIAAGTDDAGVFVSKDFGFTWTMSHCTTEGEYYALGSSDKAGTGGTAWTIVAIGLNSDVYISRNTGVSWTTISPVTYSSGSSYGSSIGVNTHGQVIQVTYTSSAGTTLYSSSDYGSTWSSVTPSFTLSYISSNSESGQYIISGGVGAIYVSSDFGATWSSASVPNTTVTYTYSAINYNGQFAAIVGGSQIYFSSDYGMTWTLTNAPSKTFVSLSTNYVGDHWVTAADGGRVIVGRVSKK